MKTVYNAGGGAAYGVLDGLIRDLDVIPAEYTNAVMLAAVVAARTQVEPGSMWDDVLAGTAGVAGLMLAGEVLKLQGPMDVSGRTVTTDQPGRVN
jgi:hypothetical protein